MITRCPSPSRDSWVTCSEPAPSTSPNLGGDFQYVPYECLSEEVARIQEVKVAYFERFWDPSGKVAVRTLATAAAAEVGLIPSSHPSFFLCLFLAKIFLAQELIPDQPSEDNQTSEVRRSPSGCDAGGSSGAQV